MQHHHTAAALLSTALALFSAPAAAVNKCAIEGKTVYQETPCDNAKKVDLSGAGKADPSGAGAAYWRRQIAGQQRAGRAEAAIAQREVFIGMTADEARLSWGEPSRINSTIGSYGRHEQWVYRRSGGTQYIYIQNGKVSSIQTPN